MTIALAIIVSLAVGLLLAAWAKRWSRRTAAKLIPAPRPDADPDHVHGAWCHPSADGCPDRPGM